MLHATSVRASQTMPHVHIPHMRTLNVLPVLCSRAMADTKQGRRKKALREAKAAELRTVDAYFEQAENATDDDIDIEDLELDPDVRAAYLADDRTPYIDATDD